MSQQQEESEDEEIILECTICGTEIRPEQGDEFKHVQDSKTGKDLVFCQNDGTMLAQLISMDLSADNSFLEEVREKVAEKYAKEIGGHD